MKRLYVEAALDAYKYLDRNIKLLDARIMRKACSSFRCQNKSTEEVMIDIIELQTIKMSLIDIKEAINEVLNSLHVNSQAYVYRRFLRMSSPYTTHSVYIKNSDKILHRFAIALENRGIDSDRFVELMTLEVIRNSIKAVKHRHGHDN